MWPYPWTHVGTPSHLGHMDRVAATMSSQAHAGAAQEAPDIGQWEGQDVPLVRPSSCNVKGGIPSSRRCLPTYLPGQAVGGGSGPQQGHGAHRASAFPGGAARSGAGCPAGAPHTLGRGGRPAQRGVARGAHATCPAVYGGGGGRGDVHADDSVPAARAGRDAAAADACPPSRGKRAPSGGCGWTACLPPIRWAWRIWGGWWCWKGRSIGPVFGWSQGN